jgi:hypothetical protein
MSGARAALLGLVLAVAIGGCQSKSGEGGGQPAPDPNTPVPVEIENHYQGDLVIYLVQSGHRQRLGLVTALGRALYTVPYHRFGLGSDVRLLAYPIAGSRSVSSEPLLLQPGQTVSWTLEADLDGSNLVIY